MKRFAVVAAFGLLVSGCYSTATGYQGKLTFGYESNPEDFGNFVKPIAPGAKLDVVAFANGSEKTLVITKAVSSKPSVVKVSQKDDHTITLLGGEPGVADIELSARDASGVVQTDRMFFHVGKPQRHLIRHGCTKEKEAIYVGGDTAWVSHDMKTSDNRPVIGYDYAPMTMEPPGGVELIDQPQDFPGYIYKLPNKSAKVTLTSSVDKTSLTFTIVDRGELSQAELLGGGRAFEGTTTYVGARVKSGQTPVCSQDSLTKAKSLTPDLCDVSANLEDDDEDGGGGKDENRQQVAVVTAKKFGICKYELTLPELAGGKGVSLKGEVEIGRYEFPRDKKNDVLAPMPPVAHRGHHGCGHRWSRPLLGGTLAWLFSGLFVLPNLIGIALLTLRRRRR